MKWGRKLLIPSQFQFQWRSFWRWGWTSNFLPHIAGCAISYPWMHSSLSMSAKGVGGTRYSHDIHSNPCSKYILGARVSFLWYSHRNFPLIWVAYGWHIEYLSVTYISIPICQRLEYICWCLSYLHQQAISKHDFGYILKTWIAFVPLKYKENAQFWCQVLRKTQIPFVRVPWNWSSTEMTQQGGIQYVHGINMVNL